MRCFSFIGFENHSLVAKYNILEKYKVILLGPAYPFRGGIANYTERLAKAFQDSGHEVSVHTFSMQYPNFLFPGKTQFSEDAAPAHLAITRSFSSVNPLSWFSSAKKIKEAQADLILVQYWLPFMGPCLGTIARNAKKGTSTKVISIAHNIIPHEKRLGDFSLTKYFAGACDGFVAMSRAVLKDIEQFTDNPHKIFYPHPIYDNYGNKIDKSVARKHLGIANEDAIVLFFGLVRKYKGLDILLEAMADERLKNRKVKLVIAGEYYDDPKTYNDLIERLELSDRIIQKAEFIPNDEVKHYFCAADIVAQPYRHATQSGISQIAYNFERPMLVTNVGGLAEIVPDGKVGYVVDKSPKAIADALVDFYKNNKEALFASNLVIEKQRFSWEAMVEAILTLYSNINSHS